MTTDVPEACSVAMKATFQGEEVVNVFNMFKRDLTPMTVANLTTIHTALKDTAANSLAWLKWASRLDTGYVCSEIYSRTHSTTAPVELHTSVNLVGTSGGNDLLPMTCFLVKFTTSLADRRARGRMYVSGLNVGMWNTTDTDYLDSTWQAGTETPLDAWVAAWKAHATFGLCVFSRKTQEEGGPTPYEEIQAAAIQSRLALQRRRSPGR